MLDMLFNLFHQTIKEENIMVMNSEPYISEIAFVLIKY